MVFENHFDNRIGTLKSNAPESFVRPTEFDWFGLGHAQADFKFPAANVSDTSGAYLPNVQLAIMHEPLTMFDFRYGLYHYDGHGWARGL